MECPILPAPVSALQGPARLPQGGFPAACHTSQTTNAEHLHRLHLHTGETNSPARTPAGWPTRGPQGPFQTLPPWPAVAAGPAQVTIVHVSSLPCWAAGLLAAGAAWSFPSSSIIIGPVRTEPGGVLAAPQEPHHRTCHNPRRRVLLVSIYRKGNGSEEVKAPMITQPGAEPTLQSLPQAEQRRHRAKV